MQADAISLAPDREQTPAEKLAQHRAEQDLTLRLIRDKTIGLAVVRRTTSWCCSRRRSWTRRGCECGAFWMEESMHSPPANFTMCAEGVYRGGCPSKRNCAFLRERESA